MGDKLYSFDDHPEHREQLSSYRDQWIANALNCEAMTETDRAIMRDAIDGLYDAAELPRPDKILFVSSPLVGAITACIASGAWWLRENPDEAATLFGCSISAPKLMLAVAVAAAEGTRRCIQAYRGEPIMQTSSWRDLVVPAVTAGATAGALAGATDAVTLDIAKTATATATSNSAFDLASHELPTENTLDDAVRDATDSATECAAALHNATNDKTKDATDDAAIAATGGALGDMGAGILDAAVIATATAVNNSALNLTSREILTEGILDGTVLSATDSATELAARFRATSDSTEATTRAATAGVTDGSTLTAVAKETMGITSVEVSGETDFAVNAATDEVTHAAIDAATNIATHSGTNGETSSNTVTVKAAAETAMDDITRQVQLFMAAATYADSNIVTRPTTRLTTQNTIRAAIERDSQRAAAGAVRAATDAAVQTSMRGTTAHDTWTFLQALARLELLEAEKWTARAVANAVCTAVDAATITVATYNATRDVIEEATYNATRDVIDRAADTDTRDTRLESLVDTDTHNNALALATNAVTQYAVNATTDAANDTVMGGILGDVPLIATQTAMRAVNAMEAATNDTTEASTTKLAADITVSPLIDSKMFNAAHVVLRSAIDVATRNATDIAAQTAHTHSAAESAAHVDAVRQHSPLEAVVEFLIGCTVHWWKFWNGGNMWSGWVAHPAFFRHVAKLDIDYSKWQHYETAAIHGGPRFMHRRFCIISDRPELIHLDPARRPHRIDGPHIRWRDGVELHHIHGIRVPARVTAGDFTARDVLDEGNAEVRRVMITKYNTGDNGRWIRDLGAQPIHADVDAMGRPRRLYRIALPGDEPYLYVEVSNSTPELSGERAGTIKTYGFRVHPELRPAADRGARYPDPQPQELTCQNAVASKYGYYGNEYRPVLET